MTTAKKGARPAARPKPRTPANSPLLAGLADFGDPRELARVVAGKAAPGPGYTTTRPTLIDAAGVAAVRGELGMNQTAFAAYLLVSVQTVQAWEQGRNPVTGAALRLLTAMRDDLAYWKRKATAG